MSVDVVASFTRAARYSGLEHRQAEPLNPRNRLEEWWRGSFGTGGQNCIPAAHHAGVADG